MKVFAALAVLALYAPPSTTPPLCHVTAISSPVPWPAAPGMLPFHYLQVQTTPDCPANGEAHVRLAGYGFRLAGPTLTVTPARPLRLGPLPAWRFLEWLASSGVPYSVPQRAAP